MRRPAHPEGDFVPQPLASRAPPWEGGFIDELEGVSEFVGQVALVEFTGSQIKHEFRQLVVIQRQVVTVGRRENIHGHRGNTFVAVEERVVLAKMEDQKKSMPIASILGVFIMHAYILRAIFN
jgi:hypothetical protein